MDSDTGLEQDTGIRSTEDLAGAGSPQTTEQSLWDQLAQAREESAQARETFIAIPGYKGIDLLARYRLLEGHEIEKIARRSMGKKKQRQAGSMWDRNLSAAMDTMAEACTGIYYQREGDEEPQALAFGDEPIFGFGDPGLVTGLRLDPSLDTVRKVILAMFGGNDLAISDHAIRLNRWFTDTNIDVDEDFLGEG